MAIEYNIRSATIDDLSQLATLEIRVRTLVVENGELPQIHLVPQGDAEKKLFEILNDVNRVILVAQVDGQIKGKGHLNFYPERGTLTLSSFEIDPEVEGIGIAVEFVKTGITMANKKYPNIQTLRIGRYDMSENNRQHGGKGVTFFDFVAKQAGVTVEPDEWKGESMRYYNIPFPVAERLTSWYEKLHSRFPIS